jgi:proliferating cell nuclear antigen
MEKPLDLIFKFRINQKYFQSLLELISSVVTEAPFRVTNEGLRIRAMEPSHVAMIDFELPRCYFEEYFLLEEAEFLVNVNDLLNIVKRSRGECDVTVYWAAYIEYKEVKKEEEAEKVETKEETVEEAEKVEKKIYNPEIITVLFEGKQTRKFTQPIMTEAVEWHPIPVLNQEHWATFTVTSKSFKEALADFTSMRTFDHIVFYATPVSFTMEAQEGDRRVEERWGEDSPDLLLPPQNFARGVYSVSYLKDIAKASNLSGALRISFGSDLPVEITIEPKQGGRLTYWLAPRVEYDNAPKRKEEQAEEQTEEQVEEEKAEEQVEEEEVVEEEEEEKTEEE